MAHPQNPYLPEALLQRTDWIRMLARSLVRDEDTADDLIQEACVAALRRPPGREGAWRPWLRQVMGNFARLAHRSESNRLRREVAAARPESIVADPSELLVRAEMQKKLMEHVLELEEPYRSTVLLRFFEGRSPAEIAAAQGVPVTTVRGRVTTALERLRGRLDRAAGGDRETWRLALLPIAGLTSAVLSSGKAAVASAPAAVAASTHSWLLTGAWIMAPKSIIAGAAGIAVLAAGITVGARWMGPDGDAQAVAELQARHDRAIARVRTLEQEAARRSKRWSDLVAQVRRSAAEAGQKPVPAAVSPGPEAGAGGDALGMLRELLRTGEFGPEYALTEEDLLRTIEKHGREPEFLVAAALLTGDPEMARSLIDEALEREPDSPSALLALLDLQIQTGERSEAVMRTIEALKAADPTSFLPHCYAAALKLTDGDGPGALAELRESAAKPHSNNYDGMRYSLLETFHREAGQPESVAKVLAMAGTRSEELRRLGDLSKGVSTEIGRLAGLGRMAEALEYARAGVELGSRVSASSRTILEDMLGRVVERRALEAERAALQGTGDESRLPEIEARLAILSQRDQRSKTIVQSYSEALLDLDENAVVRFFDAVFAQGEAAAAITLPAVREALRNGEG